MGAKYQVYKDVAGKFRFRLRAENNKIVAVSEAYEQHAGCLNGVKSVQTNCNAEIEDMTIEGKRIPNPKYQVFYDKTCGYRFHLNARNGEIIAKSEAYETKDGCMNGIRAVQASCNAEIEDLAVTKKPVAVEPEMEAVAATAAASAVAMPMAASVGTAETTLELYDLPARAAKGDIVSFQGKLIRSDTGAGVPDARVDINERDRSFFNDELLAHTHTTDDGSFSVDWKARHLDWWDDTGEIYAHFRGNENAKPAKTGIHKIIIK
ncbi:YegP family protein [Candidatus Bathyarchaeota archaeon]|nr:YegP family protein [Candidatus Bathyarchaeota archaeon]